MDMNFKSLGLGTSILANLENIGFTTPTPVQEKTIPLILKGQDIAALAPTGTGKTGAFLLPLIDRVLLGREGSPAGFTDWKTGQFNLVLLPTRELADQVQQSFLNWTQGMDLQSVVVVGGENMDKQIQAIKQGVQFVFSTPGRLLDLYREHQIDLKQVRGLVFDEADRLFDMGFKDDMVYILQRVPRERQLLLFSATLNFEVLETAYSFGSEPVEVSLGSAQLKSDNVEDKILHISHEDKGLYLLSVIKSSPAKQIIVFTNYKNQVDLLATFLRANQVSALGISSLLSQPQRQKVMAQFRADHPTQACQVLVATDVAARGLDVTGVDLVVNYELPQDAESYVHRIGRTGRAGELGKAYSLVCDRDLDSLKRIESYLKQPLETLFLEDAELIKDFTPLYKIRMPAFQGANDHHQRPSRQMSSQRPARNNSSSERSGKRSDHHRHSSGTADQSRSTDNRSSGQAPRQGPVKSNNSKTSNSSRPQAKGQPTRPHRNKPANKTYTHPKQNRSAPNNSKPTGFLGKIKKLIKDILK